MSICLCFSYFTPACDLCALFVVPEQAGTLFMHQNPSGKKAAEEDTVQGRKQLMDTVLMAQGKNRALSASSSDLLLVRLFVVTEELKKGLG